MPIQFPSPIAQPIQDNPLRTAAEYAGDYNKLDLQRSQNDVQLAHARSYNAEAQSKEFNSRQEQGALAFTKQALTANPKMHVLDLAGMLRNNGYSNQAAVIEKQVAEIDKERAQTEHFKQQSLDEAQKRSLASVTFGHKIVSGANTWSDIQPAIDAIPPTVMDFSSKTLFKTKVNDAMRSGMPLDQFKAQYAPLLMDMKDKLTLEQTKVRDLATAGNYESEANNRIIGADGKVNQPLVDAKKAIAVAGKPPAIQTVELTPEGRKAYADLATSGKLPTGWGGRALADRNNFLNDEGMKRYGAGGTGTSLAGEQADAIANRTALTNVTKDLAAIRPYKEMLDTNVDIAINLAGKIIKTDSKLLNRPLTWIMQNMGDNPDVGEFMAQNHFVITESARVLSNPRLVGQLTDRAIKDMQSVVDGNAPLGTYTRVLTRIKSDGQNRVSAMEKERASLEKSFGPKDASPSKRPPLESFVK